MSRDKEGKSLQGRLKQYFKWGKTANPPTTIDPVKFVLTNEILQDLGKEAPSTGTRVRTMRELTDDAILSKLEPNGVEKLWSYVQDMFLKEYPTEVRHTTFIFLQCLIRNQYEKIDMMRAQFFRFVKHHDNPQDLAQRIDLLATLTNNGKDVEHFGEEIGPFLLAWIDVSNKVGKLPECLTMVDNVIKFNSTHLDGNMMTGFVKHLCVLCCNSNQSNTVNLCLQILGTVVAYSILPPEALTQFVGTLCRTINLHCYCAQSWKTMKNLLGTHLGHSTIFTMCRFLKEPNLKNDAGLMRGCVFYIHMALWDINSMPNLSCPPSSVLPSVFFAVKCDHPSVNYEVLLGIQKLINKHGLELLEPTWDIVLEIVMHIINQIERAPNEMSNTMSMVTLHEVLNTVENLIEVGNYKGSMKQFFEVIHELSRVRPEASVLKLVNYHSKSIRPTENAWLQNLFTLLTNYFQPVDQRTNIRLKALSVLSRTLQYYGEYEEELINRIVIPRMKAVPNDEDVVVRSEVGKLLINVCMNYSGNKGLDLLKIVEKLLMRPYDKTSVSDMLPSSVKPDFSDTVTLITGLVPLFSKKIHRLPSSHAVKIHTMMVQFLERHIDSPVFKNFNQPRLLLFDCLMKIRAEDSGCLNYPDQSGRRKGSPFLYVTHKSAEGNVTSPPPPSPGPMTQHHLACKLTYLNMDTGFRLYLTYLENEKDWEVLKLILEKLPDMLSNKCLIVSRTHGNLELNNLVSILCSMLHNKDMGLPETLNVKVARLEFQTAVVSVMTGLSSYGGTLDLQHQQMLINALKRSTGTDPRCSRQSINALTICMVDMRESMMKLLPEVLLHLSKISATNYIAMPILEFLSTLSQLPTVYGNFVGDQYMAVFAIALPYTNPFKYDTYIVSLAYHVISVWFLKCRLPFRKDFVKFIVSGLQTNVMRPYKDLSQFKLNMSTMNQDSSDRKRSSSLTEQSSRRRATAVAKLDTTGNGGGGGNAAKTGAAAFLQKTTRDKAVGTFYEELNETCIDLMARYTYSPCSALPSRLPTAEFLLHGGITKSWMLGNKLISITTSGCTERILKHGVCDKCWTVCSRINSNKVARYARSNSGGGGEERESLLPRQGSSEESSSTTTSSSGATNKRSGADFPRMGASGDDGAKKDPGFCACWCQGWAEILVRRPTGNVSWVMKVQNQVSFKQLIFEFPLNEMSTLYMPSLHFEPSSATSIEEQEEGGQEVQPVASTSRPVSVPGSPTKHQQAVLTRQASRDYDDDELEFVYDDGTKSRNPVRRSNSSPEMAANGKHPFCQSHHASGDGDDHDASSKNNKKDVRVSCEAIPEEIAGMGTSPPSTVDCQHPAALITCHSYPGSSSSPPRTADDDRTAKPYRTVPASPNTVGPGDPPLGRSHDRVLERPNNLPNLSNLAPLSAKPPQSPTQTSPRLPRNGGPDDGNQIQKSSSSSKLEKSRARSLAIEPSSMIEKRDRVHTISVMSTSANSATRKQQTFKKVPKEILKSGLNPSFIFLQLYYTAAFGKTTDVPLQVPATATIDRAIGFLDRMYPYEVHKIGVLFVGEGQADKEAHILRNVSGTLRYLDFLQNLGSLIRLADVNPRNVFLGGIDQNGSDGKYLYTHQDDLVMLAFHVATLMPNKENDPNCNLKKAHIGNDNVVVVYNNSGDEFNISTFKSQVTLVYIIVEPLEFNCNRVVVKVKSEVLQKFENMQLQIMGSNEVIVVSDQSVSILVRQLAIHADLAATVLNSLRSHATDPYASTWLERLRKLKNLREKVVQEIKSQRDSMKGFSDDKDIVEDFTDFT